MRDSKTITKVLFICLPSAWFRATVNGRVSTKFPTCVIDNFCVWQKMNKKSLLISCIKLRKATITSVMSVCLSVCTHGRNFMNFGTWIFFEHLSWKFKFRVNLTRKTALWLEDMRIITINSRFFYYKFVSVEYYIKDQTHILWQKRFFGKSWQLRDDVKEYCSLL